MNNKTKNLLILMTCLVVNSLTGCATALHGPCKTLSIDLRPNYGKLGPDICLTDRCLGWVVGRNRGPFHHLGQGTLDPGCGPNNSGSLIRGTQSIFEQFPKSSGSGGQFLAPPAQGQIFQPQQGFQQQPFLQQPASGQLLQQPPVIPQAFFDPFRQ